MGEGHEGQYIYGHVLARGAQPELGDGAGGGPGEPTLKFNNDKFGGTSQVLFSYSSDPRGM
eukprot:COSAG02_NODE_7299_length_3077_cov_2.805910_3_plen_61_part_00